VTAAGDAGLYFAIGRADAGVTALLVPRATPGVRVGPPLTTAGLSGARLAPVEFDACELGPEALLGRVGAGLAVFQIAMAFERALILAFRLGAMQAALDAAVRFARTREVGGASIGRHQAVAHRIARMKMRLESSRMLVYRAAWVLDRGERGQAEAALAKWHLAEAAVASSLDDVTLRGGAGFLAEAGFVATLGDALGGSIHSGTDDVLASIVARWLGLPAS
jgi:alkylation response protein AidB-like acyl-CoA dehydrogenase